MSNHSSSAESGMGCFRKSASMTNCVDGDALTHSSSSTAVYHCSAARLPEKLIFRCLGEIEDPFELIRLKSVNSQLARYVDSRLQRVVEMDVKKVSFDSLSGVSNSSLTSSSGTVLSATTQSNTMLLGNKVWFSHPAGYKLVMRFVDITSEDVAADESGREVRIEILMDESWTSKDVSRLHSVLQTFRKSLKRISLDAPIVELVRRTFHGYNLLEPIIP
jgi:hypothetical protein